MKKRTIQILCLALSTFGSSAASAAVFDTIESVDKLEIIAAKKIETGDRLPAGKVAEPTKDDTPDTPDTEKKN